MYYNNKTIQYAIYNREGGKAQFITDTTQVKRPSLELLTDTLKGSGINGELDMPTLAQLGSMEYEITFNRTNGRATDLFKQQMQEIETRWVTDVLNGADGKISTVGNKEIIKGIPKKYDMGSLETNSNNEATVTLEITYYKYIQLGETIIEIDKLNNVFKVRGVDYAKGIREAL